MTIDSAKFDPDMLAPRRMVYKRVKAVAPHCPLCNQRLSGNGSIATPYECLCGIWETEFDNQFRPTGMYKIKVKPL